MTRRVFLSGIGGIGMANLAALLKQAGFDVSGSDGAIYEPAATVLRQAGIAPLTPYAAENLPLDGTPIIIGNAQSRGHVEVEAALDAGAPLYSFPEFLHRFVLEGRHTMVVAGTHGKSSTTACLSHLLAATGRDPGFLVGALPLDFALGAALGKPGGPFVLEGDEYDTAFFDKRSKFLHYFPRTLLLGIVEFDHADIFANREGVLLSFQRLLRILPRNGRLIYAADCQATCELAAAAPCPAIAVGVGEKADWQLLRDPRHLSFRDPDGQQHVLPFGIPGRHNRMNALMALAGAESFEADREGYQAALSSFRGIRRRFEKLLELPQLVVYDDFAHHPTAIAATLEAVREQHPGRRVIAVFEPRSNTMVRNIFQRELTDALALADHAILGTIHRLERIPEPERLDLNRLVSDLTSKGTTARQMPNDLIGDYLLFLLNTTPSVVVFMSNASFDGIPQQFVERVTPHV